MCHQPQILGAKGANSGCVCTYLQKKVLHSEADKCIKSRQLYQWDDHWNEALNSLQASGHVIEVQSQKKLGSSEQCTIMHHSLLRCLMWFLMVPLISQAYKGCCSKAWLLHVLYSCVRHHIQQYRLKLYFLLSFDPAACSPPTLAHVHYQSSLPPIEMQGSTVCMSFYDAIVCVQECVLWALPSSHQQDQELFL